jgi:hypothetical protein
MDMESSFGVMEGSMKECGKVVNSLEKEPLSMRMRPQEKESGSME